MLYIRLLLFPFHYCTPFLTLRSFCVLLLYGHLVWNNSRTFVDTYPVIHHQQELFLFLLMFDLKEIVCNGQGIARRYTRGR